MRAKVRHSQMVLALPAQPWVVAESKGTIMAAHCTCMAGLGEVCYDVTALLFTLEAHTKYKHELSCTSQPCNPVGGLQTEFKEGTNVLHYKAGPI